MSTIVIVKIQSINLRMSKEAVNQRGHMSEHDREILGLFRLSLSEKTQERLSCKDKMSLCEIFKWKHEIMP